MGLTSIGNNYCQFYNTYDSVGNKAMGEYLFICYYDAQQACDASLKKIFHNGYGVVLHKGLLID
jgi:hypothetical protein